MCLLIREIEGYNFQFASFHANPTSYRSSTPNEPIAKLLIAQETVDDDFGRLQRNRTY